MTTLEVDTNYLVIDTEGSDELSEIAIVNAQGVLIYEAFSATPFNRPDKRQNIKPLREILLDFFGYATNKRVVCHFAEHDRQVIERSCKKVGLTWKRSLQFVCTYELAHTYSPEAASYSLEYLSKKFNLKVNHHYFNSHHAHRARYDAAFTYQLYRKMMELQLQQSLQGKPNPFSSNKVDNPFQDHPDLKQVFQIEFERLKATIEDIKLDYNHQSQGAVIIGEPGVGKTHLIMRLAKELLQVNRLLFIGQPNNPDTVLYHIYTRILKSFIELVPSNKYTQLENLLARSFVQVLRSIPEGNLLKAEQQILAFVADEPLKLYQLAKDKPDQRQRLWQQIERRTNEWWIRTYGQAGFSAQVIKGIIKFCRFEEPRRKDIATRWLAAHDLSLEDLELVGLENWGEDLSKEDFSLEAISVFSKLSLLDEPLIIVFDQLEGLGLESNKSLLERFGEAVKELFTYVPNSLIILNLFPNRWQQFQSFFDGSVVDRISQHRITLQRPTDDQLTKILQLKARSIGVELNTLFNQHELEIILDQPSIRSVLNRAADYYRYKQGISPPPHPENPPPSPKTAEERLDQLEQQFNQFQRAIQSIASALGTLYSPGGSPPEPEPPKPELPEPERRQPNFQQQVIDYLQTQKRLLEEDYDRPQIITANDDLGKLITITEAFRTIQSFEIDYLQLGRRKLPEHRLFRGSQTEIAIGFLYAGGGQFTSLLKNYNELVLINKDTNFLLWRDAREAPITGKVGLEEIEKLNHTSNGKFVLMQKDDRVNFELMYKLIVDIQNHDLEVNLITALKVLQSEFSQDWLIQTLQALI